MAGGDDSTGVPVGRRELVLGGAALGLGGVGEGRSEGMALLDALVPAMAVWDEEEPGYAEAVAAAKALRARLDALAPRCLGDAVAKLLTVLVAGETLPPSDARLIVSALDHLTASAPHLRRPMAIHAALAQSRTTFPHAA